MTSWYACFGYRKKKEQKAAVTSRSMRSAKGNPLSLNKQATCVRKLTRIPVLKTYPSDGCARMIAFISLKCFLGRFLGLWFVKKHDTDAHAKMPNLRTPGQYGPTALGLGCVFVVATLQCFAANMAIKYEFRTIYNMIERDELQEVVVVFKSSSTTFF